MADRETRTIALPPEEADYVDALVAAGPFSSPSEVVRAGLQALQEREASLDNWLKEEVVPVYDAMKRDPNRAVSGADVVAAIDARHAERSKGRKRGA